MPSKALLLASLVFLLAAPVAGAHVASNIPDPPLTTWASKGPQTGTTVRTLIMARSATDMPVPGVKVTITTCHDGQQDAFHYRLGRKLDTTQEKLVRSMDGKTLTWTMFSAAANTDLPTRLPIEFKLPVGHSGPTFCIRVYGETVEGTKPTDAKSIIWRLG